MTIDPGISAGLQRAGTLLVGLLVVLPLLRAVERFMVGRIHGWRGRRGVRPASLLRPLARGLKLLGKSGDGESRVQGVAPVVALLPALMLLPAVPLGIDVGAGEQGMGLDVHVGVAYVLGLVALLPHGALLAGWSSRTHTGQLASLRKAAGAGGIAALGLCLIGVVLVSGSVRLGDIALAQMEMVGSVPLWNAWVQPVGFAVYLVAVLLVASAPPFDAATQAGEMRGGYLGRYGGIRLALFAASHYTFLLAAALVGATSYLGGHHLPHLPAPGTGLPVWMGSVALIGKTGLILVLLISLGAGLPRLPAHRLAPFGWKVLLPLAGLNLAITAGLILLT